MSGTPLATPRPQSAKPITAGTGSPISSTPPSAIADERHSAAQQPPGADARVERVAAEARDRHPDEKPVNAIAAAAALGAERRDADRCRSSRPLRPRSSSPGSTGRRAARRRARAARTRPLALGVRMRLPSRGRDPRAARQPERDADEQARPAAGRLPPRRRSRPRPAPAKPPTLQPPCSDDMIGFGRARARCRRRVLFIATSIAALARPEHEQDRRRACSGLVASTGSVHRMRQNDQRRRRVSPTRSSRGASTDLAGRAGSRRVTAERPCTARHQADRATSRGRSDPAATGSARPRCRSSRR